jgi:hypothetical protein
MKGSGTSRLQLRATFDLNDFTQFILDELVILLSIRDATRQNYVGRLASEMRALRRLTIGYWKSA